MFSFLSLPRSAPSTSPPDLPRSTDLASRLKAVYPPNRPVIRYSTSFLLSLRPETSSLPAHSVERLSASGIESTATLPSAPLLVWASQLLPTIPFFLASDAPHPLAFALLIEFQSRTPYSSRPGSIHPRVAGYIQQAVVLTRIQPKLVELMFTIWSTNGLEGGGGEKRWISPDCEEWEREEHSEWTSTPEWEPWDDIVTTDKPGRVRSWGEDKGRWKRPDGRADGDWKQGRDEEKLMEEKELPRIMMEVDEAIKQTERDLPPHMQRSSLPNLPFPFPFQKSLSKPPSPKSKAPPLQLGRSITSALASIPDGAPLPQIPLDPKAFEMERRQTATREVRLAGKYKARMSEQMEHWAETGKEKKNAKAPAKSRIQREGLRAFENEDMGSAGQSGEFLAGAFQRGTDEDEDLLWWDSEEGERGASVGPMRKKARTGVWRGIDLIDVGEDDEQQSGMDGVEEDWSDAGSEAEIEREMLRDGQPSSPSHLPVRLSPSLIEFSETSDEHTRHLPPSPPTPAPPLALRRLPQPSHDPEVVPTPPGSTAASRASSSLPPPPPRAPFTHHDCQQPSSQPVLPSSQLSIFARVQEPAPKRASTSISSLFARLESPRAARASVSPIAQPVPKPLSTVANAPSKLEKRLAARIDRDAPSYATPSGSVSKPSPKPAPTLTSSLAARIENANTPKTSPPPSAVLSAVQLQLPAGPSSHHTTRKPPIVPPNLSPVSLPASRPNLLNRLSSSNVPSSVQPPSKLPSAARPRLLQRFGDAVQPTPTAPIAPAVLPTRDAASITRPPSQPRSQRQSPSITSVKRSSPQPSTTASSTASSSSIFARMAASSQSNPNSRSASPFSTSSSSIASHPSSACYRPPAPTSQAPSMPFSTLQQYLHSSPHAHPPPLSAAEASTGVRTPSPPPSSRPSPNNFPAVPLQQTQTRPYVVSPRSAVKRERELSPPSMAVKREQSPPFQPPSFLSLPPLLSDRKPFLPISDCTSSASVSASASPHLTPDLIFPFSTTQSSYLSPSSSSSHPPPRSTSSSFTPVPPPSSVLQQLPILPPDFPLPPGWERRVSKRKGTVYYWKRETDETSWTLPLFD
jgi:hypothetical protein